MSYLNQNIKYLRKNKGYTQSDLAERLGVTRSMIGAYEEERAEPKIETIQKLAYLFELSLEQLINQDLNNGLDTPRVDEKGKTLRILPIVIDQNNQEQISVVPVSARAGYTHGYSDPDYIRDLPKFNLPLPELYSGKSYRLFQIEGDSMLPIPDGSYIIGEYVENWQNIKEGESHVLITHSRGLVYKRVWREGTNLLLKSDNLLYEPYRLPTEELIEVWRGLAYISFSLPGPEDKNESDIKQLSQIVLQLKSDMDALMGKNQ